ncbi:MAG: hypothetical protein HPY53_11810 [Brevinematales bacterium]|nr:hypothetical protein [Brevinematales bacterium]
MIIRLRMDQIDSFDYSKSTWYSYGFLRIRDICDDYVIVDVLLYNESGKETVNKQGIRIGLGDSVKLNNDSFADLAYVLSPSTMSPEFKGTRQLQFLSSQEKLLRTMFMLLPDEYAGGSLPSGITVVNPSGFLVVNIDATNIEGTDSFLIRLNDSNVPQLRAGDFLANSENGKVYRVNKYICDGSGNVTVTAVIDDQANPYELMYMNFKGTVEEIAQKYASTSEERTKAYVKNLKHFAYDNYIVNYNGLTIRLRNTADLDLILDGKAQIGWKWAYGWISVELRLKGNMQLDVSITKSLTYNTEKCIVNPPPLIFPLGIIPVQISFPIYIGVDAWVTASGNFHIGYNYTAGLGAKFEAYIAKKKSYSKFTPIKYFNLTKTEPSLTLSGSIGISPYISVRPTLSLAWLLHAGVDARVYISASLNGSATFTPTSKSGSISMNIDLGLKASGFVGIGIRCINLYKQWNFGTLFNVVFPIYRWTWSMPITPPPVIEPGTPATFNSVVNNNGSVSLSWSAGANATGYYVYKETNNILISKFYTESLNYVDTAVSPNVSYTYYVTTTRSLKESLPTVDKTALVPLPATPTGFTVIANNNGTISLVWNSVSGSLGYQLTRTSSGDPDKVINLTVNSYTDTEIENGHSYNYKVANKNYVGYGTNSVVKSATFTSQLLFWCKFESKLSIDTPEIGPSGICSNDSFGPGKYGNAYVADSSEKYGVVFPKSIIPPTQGCIEFWGKLTGCSGNISYNTYFFNAGDGSTDITKKKQWNMVITYNDGWGFGGLASRCANGGAGTGDYGSYTYEGILGDPTAWHHYALVWSSTGVPGSSYNMQIFLDGVKHGDCLVDYVPITYDPYIFNAPLTNNFFLLWTWEPNGTVAIDNLKIWNYPKVNFSDRFTE